MGIADDATTLKWLRYDDSGAFVDFEERPIWAASTPAGRSCRPQRQPSDDLPTAKRPRRDVHPAPPPRARADEPEETIDGPPQTTEAPADGGSERAEPDEVVDAEPDNIVVGVLVGQLAQHRQAAADDRRALVLLASENPGIIDIKTMGAVEAKDLSAVPADRRSACKSAIRELVEDATFHPFAVRSRGGAFVDVVDDRDPRLVAFKGEYGSPATEVLIAKTREIQEYSSARYYVDVPWNYAADRPLAVAEGIQAIAAFLAPASQVT